MNTTRVPTKQRCEILIAEDSATQAQRLRFILEQEGYHVSVCGNGREALALAQQNRPTLIISDVVMPEMDGYELCRQIKSDAALSSVPVLLVTTLSDPNDVIRGLECGADNFILKPYDERHLISRVQYVLLNTELRRDDSAGMGVEIVFKGRRHVISSDRLQILNLLLSTYDAAFQRNEELIEVQRELREANDALGDLNRNLESIVAERTAELHRSERELRATFERAAVGIVHVDVKGRFQRVNPRMCLITGYSADELIGMSLAALAHPEDLAVERAQIGNLLSGQVASLSLEKRLVQKNGSLLWIQLSASVVRDDHGAVNYVVGFIEDISVRKQAEGELLQLNEQLEARVVARTTELELARHDAEQANRAKSAFLAAMSHEIRTPMNGVIGMIDVLHQTSLKGHQVEMVDVIHESAYALLTLIDDILDFSKIEAGRLEIESAPMSLGNIVESVCKVLDRQAAQADVELTLFVDPAIPDTLMGDALRVRQILLNLINNAIKFSSGRLLPGKVSVRVNAVRHQDGNVTVVLRIADNGIGMSSATVAKLFQPFQQADVSTTRRYGGTGLGLAITHFLVNHMGGSIVVASEPDAGTTFIVELPFAVFAEQTTHPVSGEVKGLRCILVGGPDSLADDFAAYLRHREATAERVHDLPALGAALARSAAGKWICIVESGRCAHPSDDTLSSLAGTRTDLDLRFLLIGRGQRRLPRCERPGHVQIDGDVLGRRAFLHAVALAAGRVLAIEHAALDNHGERTAISRAEALLRGQLILVAEDNRTNQKVILQQLSLLGYAADVVGDGVEALDRWRNGEHALLITDLHMPRLDGYQLTATIREAEIGKRRTPIIALTANALRGEAERCLAAGMDEYLSKPIGLGTLKAALEKWVPLMNVPSTPVGDRHLALDVRVLHGLIGHEPELVADILHEYRSGTQKLVADLVSACTERRPLHAAAIAHRLKSSSRAVGALTLGDVCEEVERLGEIEQCESLPALAKKLMQEWTSVLERLDEALGTKDGETT